MRQDCVFCRELNGSRDTNFARLYPEVSDRLIAETSDLAAFPCIGQLAQGHSLIVTKAHYSNFAEAFRSIPNLADQLKVITADAHEYLGSDASETLYFEHGSFCSDDGGCGIYHAHLHFIPRAGHVHVGALGEGEIETTQTLLDAYATLNDGKPYALIGSETVSFQAEVLTAPLPSQTIRKKVASALNVTAWDWRDAVQEKWMFELLSRKQA